MPPWVHGCRVRQAGSAMMKRWMRTIRVMAGCLAERGVVPLCALVCGWTAALCTGPVTAQYPNVGHAASLPYAAETGVRPVWHAEQTATNELSPGVPSSRPIEPLPRYVASLAGAREVLPDPQEGPLGPPLAPSAFDYPPLAQTAGPAGPMGPWGSARPSVAPPGSCARGPVSASRAGGPWATAATAPRGIASTAWFEAIT